MSRICTELEMKRVGFRAGSQAPPGPFARNDGVFATFGRCARARSDPAVPSRVFQDLSTAFKVETLRLTDGYPGRVVFAGLSHRTI